MSKVFNRFNKRDDARIFVMAYKPGKMLDNSLYTTVECGAHFNQRHFAICDNTGDNISSLNPAYAENTGLYWVNKNRQEGLKYVGCCQYRRRLRLPQNTDFDALFNDYDAVGCCLSTKELNPAFPNVREQFCYWHNPKWLDLVTNIIWGKHRWFYNAWLKALEQDTLFASTCFVMKAEDYDKYCELLFSVLNEFMEFYGGTCDRLSDLVQEEIAAGEFIDNLAGHERHMGYIYQTFAPAFIAERILTAYMLNLGKIKIIPYEYI